MLEAIQKWLRSEKGFVVFEYSALAKGGIILAILIGTYVLSLVVFEFSLVSEEFVGSEVEANEALEQFYGSEQKDDEMATK